MTMTQARRWIEDNGATVQRQWGDGKVGVLVSRRNVAAWAPGHGPGAVRLAVRRLRRRLERLGAATRKTEDGQNRKE